MNDHKSVTEEYAEQLKKTVTNAINQTTRALENTTKSVTSNINNITNSINANINANVNPQMQMRPSQTTRPPYPQQRPAYPPQQAPFQTPAKMNTFLSTAGGTAMAVVGIGMGAVFGLADLGLLIVALSEQDFTAAVVLGVMVLITAGFGILASAGFRLRGTAKRYTRYRQIIGQRRYVAIAELASATGQQPKAAADDVQKMITKGMFRQAYLDEQRTVLMLDDETYRQYQTSLASARQRQIEQQEIASKKTGDAEVDGLIADGRKLLDAIGRTGLANRGGEEARHIASIRATGGKIFNFVLENPQKAGDIRKLMNYYLPTLLKLLQAYDKFDAASMEGENISAAKADIEDTLVKMDDAFMRLLDGLFQDNAIDVSTDITVLEAMLAQEGLAEDQMHASSSAPIPDLPPDDGSIHLEL